jgi:hypothetical protein
MRMSLLCSAASIMLISGTAFAQGEGEFPATLKGHAVLPAQTFIEAPADALTISRLRANTPRESASMPSAA